jgi:tRNA dimethylallyltransferase
MERDALKRRIDARIDAMLAAGAAEEVREARAHGATPTVQKALGFRELLDGDVDAMRRSTHQYTRRQVTWMRKLPGVQLFDVTGREAADVAAEIHRALTA